MSDNLEQSVEIVEALSGRAREIAAAALAENQDIGPVGLLRLTAAGLAEDASRAAADMRQAVAVIAETLAVLERDHAAQLSKARAHATAQLGYLNAYADKAIDSAKKYFAASCITDAGDAQPDTLQ